MSSPIRPGKVTWPRARSRSSHFPTPSGPTAQTRSPPRPRRCPQPPESLQEVRSRLQPTVHVHNAAHDHGLVVIDPLNLFHRQIDHIDEERESGWSVLVLGSAERVTREYMLTSLWKDGPVPWAEGTRNLFIMITPETITGRTLGPPPAD
jgi:hypothetical protein